MKPFVIIFRTGPINEAEKQRRAEETSAWARRQNEAGHKLDPHILEPEGANLANGLAISALLFLEAHDLSEATRIAESHPALRYGAQIEVRPSGVPAALATARSTDASQARS